MYQKGNFKKIKLLWSLKR